jgi:D-alanyl-D-alanine carboxypeptidase
MTPKNRYLCALLGAFFPFVAVHGLRAQASDDVTRDLPTQIVALVNDASTHARLKFLSQHLAGSARKDSARAATLLERLHVQGAPFVVVQREEFGRTRILKLRSARAKRVVTLLVSNVEGQPDSLTVVDVLASHAAVLDSLVWPTEPVRSNKQLAQSITDNLARLDRAGVFSGVVYVMKGDSVLVSYAAGLANREYEIRNAVDTRFALASIGKMFTATAILQLVDAGKLRVDDTLAQVLPAYPNQERAQRITIRQLLEHRSGMGDQWSTPKKPVPGLTGHLAIVAAVAHAPLRFEPGTRWSYSNEGYNVLAAVIEHVTGQSYREYIEQNILARAGMTETVLAGGRDDHVPLRAVGYRYDHDDVLGTGAMRANWSFIGDGGAGGAGGGYSTVRDLAQFGTALRKGVLLQQALRDSMWIGRSQISGNAGSMYGWGSFVETFGTRTAVGHGGGGNGSGMDSGFRHFTDGSYTLVVLTNADPPVGHRLTNALTQLLGRW